MSKNGFFKSFILIAFPIMLQSIATTTVNLIDNIMVGQLGNTAIAAVSTSNRFLMMFNFTLWGITGASGIFIAQYFGAKKVEEMKQSFRFSLIFSYTLLIPILVGILFFNHQIAMFFIQDLVVVEEIKKYLIIMSIGYIPFVATQNISGAMRSIKEVKIPMIATIAGVITNAILNFILIFGHFGFPRLEVSGAAIATVIARFVEFSIVYIAYKIKKYDFNTKLIDIFKVEKFRARIIFFKAVPLMLNEFAYGAGLSMLVKLYATRGAVELAAYGIAGNSTDMFYSAMQGIMVAMSVLVGHKLGENDLEAGRKNGYQSIKTVAVIGISFSMILFLIAPIFPRIYNFSNTVNPKTLQLSLYMIYIIASALWAQYVAIGNYMLLRIGGDMKSTLLLDGIFMWAVNIATVATLAYFTDFNIIILMGVGHFTDILKLILSFYFVKKEKWVHNLTNH